MEEPDGEAPRPSAEPERIRRSLIGSVTFLVSDEELIEPLYEDSEPDLVE